MKEPEGMLRRFVDAGKAEPDPETDPKKLDDKVLRRIRDILKSSKKAKFADLDRFYDEIKEKYMYVLDTSTWTFTRNVGQKRGALPGGGTPKRSKHEPASSASVIANPINSTSASDSAGAAEQLQQAELGPVIITAQQNQQPMTVQSGIQQTQHTQQQDLSQVHAPQMQQSSPGQFAR